MELLISQKNILADLVECTGLRLDDFKFVRNETCTAFLLKKDEKLQFSFRDTIQGAKYCDVYYKPTNKTPCKHIYLSINTFDEVIPYFKDWLNCLSLEVNIVDKWSKRE